jgi:hypothetical protein
MRNERSVTAMALADTLVGGMHRANGRPVERIGRMGGLLREEGRCQGAEEAADGAAPAVGQAGAQAAQSRGASFTSASTLRLPPHLT